LSTKLSDIGDLFMSKVSDYRLNEIYQTSGSMALNEYIEPYLMESIIEFNICTPPLVYTPTSGSVEGYFTDDLTFENKFMLSELMTLHWLQKVVQDILQMNNFVTDHDFKTFSAAQNLSAKQSYLNQKREMISQRLIDYEYKNNNWADWRNQKYFV
jgi:hypothetical protein